jgi:hypothetical protein
MIKRLFKKKSVQLISAILIVALIVWIVPTTPRTQAAVIEGVTTWTTTVNDQSVTVGAGLTNVCIVYVSVISDADGVHTANDAAPTFGGVTMTNAHPSGGLTQNVNSPYVVDTWYIKNYAGGSGAKTMHYGNHGGFGSYQAAVYVISGCDTTTQLDATTITSTGATANPTSSITTVSDSAILIVGLGSANAATAASSQTVDAQSGTVLSIGSKIGGAAGSQTITWTSSAGTWAQTLLAVRSVAAVVMPVPRETGILFE